MSRAAVAVLEMKLPEFGVHHYILAYVTIFGGAVLWWYFVTSLVSRLRRRINVRSLWLINRVIGIILFAMALFGVAMAVIELF